MNRSLTGILPIFALLLSCASAWSTNNLPSSIPSTAASVPSVGTTATTAKANADVDNSSPSFPIHRNTLFASGLISGLTALPLVSNAAGDSTSTVAISGTVLAAAAAVIFFRLEEMNGKDSFSDVANTVLSDTAEAVSEKAEEISEKPAVVPPPMNVDGDSEIDNVFSGLMHKRSAVAEKSATSGDSEPKRRKWSAFSD